MTRMKRDGEPGFNIVRVRRLRDMFMDLDVREF